MSVVAVLVFGTLVGLAAPAQAEVVLRDLSWSSPSVDATTGSATNELTFTVTETDTTDYLLIALVGPDDASLGPSYRISFLPGTTGGPRRAAEVARAEGWVTYRYTFEVPKYAHTEDAVWRVAEVADAALPDTLEYGFTARSVVDSTAPDYASLTSSTGNLWLASDEPVRSQYLLASVESETGLSQFEITLTGPGGDTITATSWRPTYVPHPRSELIDRTLGVVVSFPPDKQVGTWTVTEIWMTDVVGNTATYPGLSLAPVTFTDNADITLAEVAVTPTEVDNWQEDQTPVLTANVTAPAPIAAAEAIVEAPCAAGTPTLPAGTSGTVSVPITMPVGATTCAITGFAVRDQAGHVSVLGTAHGAAGLPTLTRKTGPAPEIRDIAVGVESVDWDEYTRFDVSVDLHSWSPGVRKATIWVRGSGWSPPQYYNLPHVRDGTVTVTVHTRATALWSTGLTVEVLLEDAAGLTTRARDDQTITVNRPEGISGFHPVAPTRLLDTRADAGQPVGPGGVVTVDTAVPAEATAVVLNVTADAPTAGGYLTVWPDGKPRPNTSNLNFVAGQTVANLVTVPVSPDGKVRLYNSTGSVHVVVDSFGYYSSLAGDRFHPQTPTRALDTRLAGGPLSAGGERSVDLGLVPGAVPQAVVLNVTVTDTTSSGYLTVWQDDTPRPATSNINFPAGWTGSNQVIVPVSQYEGTIRLYNHRGSANVLVDVAGYFNHHNPQDPVFVATDPTRVLDTRGGAALGPRGVRELAVPGLPANVDAVVLTVTATEPTATGYLTVWPGETARPGVSNLNFTPGRTVPNMVTVPVQNGKIQFYNHAGDTHVLADLAGYYLHTYS